MPTIRRSRDFRGKIASSSKPGTSLLDAFGGRQRVAVSPESTVGPAESGRGLRWADCPDSPRRSVSYLKSKSSG